MKFVDIVIDASTGGFQTILNDNGEPMSVKMVKESGITWEIDRENLTRTIRIPLGEGR